MTIDLNNAIANLLLDQYDTYFPAGALLELRTGAVAGAENADTGTLLVTITLPATPWLAAAAGSKSKSAGTWSAAAVAAGVIGHYRLHNVADDRREEGTVTITGGGGDATVDNTSVAVGQVTTVTSFVRTL